MDVLFHVNQFAADRLAMWIEVLDTSFQESTGRPVSFGVPDCYVQFDDRAVDLTILGELLVRN